MNNALSIKTIKKRHEVLYTKVLQRVGDLLKQDNERNKLLSNVDNLIEDIKKLSGAVSSFDEYLWLSDAAIRWQSVFSTILEKPRIIKLSQPKRAWLPPAPQENEEFSEKAIEEWVRRQAAFIAFAQIAELGSQSITSPEKNWHNAEVFFASEVLEGRINFATNISSSKSYWRLENIWLKDVKRLMAYFKWLDRKKQSFFLQHHERDFFDVCNHIRIDLLINKGMKAPLSKFTKAQSYIQEHYLGHDGKLCFPLQEGTKLHGLIKNKASRIFKTTKETDRDKNWFQAETFTRMFYENIIPAVMEKNKEKVLRVLKAFQYSKMNRFIVINCFETALAIYFLDQNIIKTLWNESAQKPLPNTTFDSIVYVDSWPQDFTIDETEGSRTRFWVDRNKIGFNGVMLDIEKKVLLDTLNKAAHEKPKEEHIKAIDDLYNQSRFIHEETTL